MTVDMLLAQCGLPRAEALLLLAHASGASRERLIAGSREPLPQAAIDAFMALSCRRAAGEPIAYLVGTREFYGRSFVVDECVLIPRPETELLVDQASQWITAHRPSRVVDLGTGSGAIAITLALERPAIEVTATDQSAAALTLAAANAQRLGAEVRFVAGDWFDALADDARFDLIVTNPPYIACDDPHLAIGDLRFEPANALTDGADGLAAIRRIVSGAPRHLTGRGALMLEHGYQQAAAVRALLAAAGFQQIVSLRDLAGIERVTVGHLRS
jgi:release factor glutamine methyltransferase